MNNKDIKIGTLCMRVAKDQGILINTSDGPIQIIVRDKEKKPTISSVVIKAPVNISEIDTFLNTYIQKQYV